MRIPHWSKGPLPDQPCARLIEDSITENGRRLTTFEMKIHRFVLAELNTHTLFSRNSASSRAIPLRKKNGGGTLDRLEANGPALPVKWASEQKGMQGGDEVDPQYQRLSEDLWLHAMRSNIEIADILRQWGVHKSVVNRLIEPFSWHVATVTAVDWEGFFKQRSLLHTELAQPEFAKVATQVEELYRSHEPTPLKAGQWHTPYLLASEKADLGMVAKCKVSTARCARTSYLTHDGDHDVEKDMVLYDRLESADPPHASPFQHVATPEPRNEFTYTIYPHVYGFWGKPHEMRVPIVGNARGWMQLRHIVLGV